MNALQLTLTALMCALISKIGATLTGECFPNATVVFTGVGANMRHVAVRQGQQSCTYHRTNDRLVVTGCSMNVPIEVAMADSEDVSAPLTQFSSQMFTCQEIAAEGVTRTMELRLAGITTQETVMILPTITIISGFRRSENGTSLISEASVGDLIYFTLDFSSAVELEVLECYADPMADDGTVNEALSMRLIGTHGCSLSIELITSFGSPIVTAAGWRRLYSALSLFRFYSFPLLQLRCTVRVCRLGSDQCRTSCSGTRRRRAGQVSDATGSFISVTQDVIRVLDAPQVALAAQESSSLSLVSTSVSIVFLLSQVV